MTKPETRIQKKNNALILEAGLKVFSQYGFRGSTLDQIATEANLSKPNLLYYFRSKDAIYKALLAQLLEDWLEPIYAIDANGDPIEEVLKYTRHKLEMSQNFPRESRLFANEILQGAPQIRDTLQGELRRVVSKVAAIMDVWVQEGRIRPVDPHHMIFSIWSITQHYADFDVQVRAVLRSDDPFPGAEQHVEDFIRRMLTPLPSA